MTQNIRLDGYLGEHISVAISRAIDEARNRGVSVDLNFNGTVITLTASDSVETAMQRWTALREAEHAAYLASPEGRAAAAREEDAKKIVEAREARGVKHDEVQMRESKPPECPTVQALAAYIESLVDGKHDYGTCVYAMSLAATAAFDYVASQLGVTGFQASCADADFIRRTLSIKGPFILIRGEDFLFPQLNPIDKLREARVKWSEWLKEEADRRLQHSKGASEGVIRHWEGLSNAPIQKAEK